MSDSVQLTFGSDVADDDGVCGVLSRVIVDPDTRALTHLVVEPRHRRGVGRLAPIELADWAQDELRLRCSRRDFDELDEADEQSRPTGLGGNKPTLPLGMSGGRLDDINVPRHGDARLITSDVLPFGGAEVRGGDHVYATDGAIGHMRGLTIASGNHQLTHVLLAEGHVFGRKEVAIPVDAVTGVGDGVVLGLTEDQVRDLPALRWHGDD